MKRILCACLSFIAIALMALPGSAQQYPSQPIKIVVAYPPGGTVDIVARLLAAKLGPELKGTVIVENRQGASGILGTDYVAKAAPDGHTLLMANASGNSVVPQLFLNVPYDPVNDFVGIGQVTIAQNILVVPTTFAPNSIKELVDLGKKKPGEINYASFGRGSAAHLSGEMFQLATGIKMTQIPYKGSGPVITDMLGGAANVHVYFDAIATPLPHIKEGRLKALAVTGAKRSPSLPQVPTIAETIPGYEWTTWQGLVAPAKTPPAVIEKLHNALAAVTKDPELLKRLDDLGLEVKVTGPAEFSAHIKAQNERIKGLLEKIGLERVNM
jgi:tripartite-type tricarboxylate transporter receptor subunit TctC